MPAGEIRQIKRRVKSVQSTKKITRAMELIASSRIIKAEQRLKSARPYAEQMRSVIANLAHAVGGSIQHPLLEVRENPRNSAVLVVAADRGLCGAYNSAVLKLAQAELAALPGENKSIVAIGRKVDSYFRYEGIAVDKLWQGKSDLPDYDTAREAAEYVMGEYTEGNLDRITLVYTNFESMFRQVPVAIPLLPVDPEQLVKRIGEQVPEEAPLLFEPTPEDVQADTIFEPPAEQILGDIIPKGVASLIFEALLESAASEHASRRRAMKAATDNANDLINALQLKGNKARQAAITTEIIEIVGGAQALEQAKQ